MDDPERLLWTALGRCERLALAQYGAQAAPLATPAKRAHVARLPPDGDAALDASPLAAPLGGVLDAVRGGSPRRVVVAQGWVLEVLGQAVYGLLQTSAGLSEEGRALADSGCVGCGSVLAALPAVLEAECGHGSARFAAFAAESQPVLERLEPLGDALDRAFAARFQLGFDDVIGVFSADLVTSCQTLGLERRQVLGHLAAGLMGLT